MKKLFTFLAVVLLNASVFAQSPQTMSYQAVIRNSSNALVLSTTIGMQISILQKSSTGDPVYIETHSTTTNANGLATIEIGGGTPVSGRFETIDWSSGPYFVKTDTDPTGGSSYSITGTSKLLSVPYALYAETSGNSGKSGFGDPWLTLGNTLTIDHTHFLGTIDNVPLNFRVSNNNAGRIDQFLFNTFFGYQSGNSVPTGSWNTAYGVNSLFNLTTGLYNTANGGEALAANTTGSSNVALGVNALFNNTTISNLVAVGDSALYSNTTGYSNTAVGSKALYANTAGFKNTANGYNALRYNTTGYANTAIGYVALINNTTGNWNTAVGQEALRDNTEGHDNTAIGDETLTANTTGNYITALGEGALFRNTTGDENTATGYSALGFNETGKSNTANGVQALFSNKTGDNNTAIGYTALQANMGGAGNTATGSASLINTTGKSNTGFGFRALSVNTIGSNNTALGFNANVNSVNINNSTVLGSNASVTQDNKMILGDNSIMVGIGLSGIASGPQNKLEINTAPITNASGLRFRQLTSASTQTPNPGTGVLSVNTSGDVILVPDACCIPLGTTPGEMLYWNGTEWAIVAIGTEGQVLTFCSGVPTWGPCTSIIPVQSPTGKYWMDRNLGATQVATSSTDADSYGDLYQWGRSTDGHQIRNSAVTVSPYPLSGTNVPANAIFILTPSTSSTSDWLITQDPALWQGITIGNNNPCPAGYRIPTSAELTAEIATFSTPDAAGAFASLLKLPVGGSRHMNSGSFVSVGLVGRYWSSTICTYNTTNSFYLDINSSVNGIGDYYRAAGFSVRCIQN